MFYTESSKKPKIDIYLQSFKHLANTKSKWITYGIIKLVQYRDNVYKKIKIFNPLSVEYFTHKPNLTTYNNILKKVLELQI